MNIPILVGATALIMIGVEATRPGRIWPKRAGWWTRAALLNGVQLAIVLAAGRLWDPWMKNHQLWSASQLPLWQGALLGYLTITFVYYWWHRARHESPFLWRWFHQIHHSPARLEIIASFYKHPLEILANGLLSSAIIYLVVGLDPGAAAVVILMTGLAELYYHWNVKTPYWTGFILQRPESHCVHHLAGSHTGNYADLPLWDILFGTFNNPRETQFSCGFSQEEEQKLTPMLMGKEVA